LFDFVADRLVLDLAVLLVLDPAVLLVLDLADLVPYLNPPRYVRFLFLFVIF
jgi:hypothetical protein